MDCDTLVVFFGGALVIVALYVFMKGTKNCANKVTTYNEGILSRAQQILKQEGGLENYNNPKINYNYPNNYARERMTDIDPSTPLPTAATLERQAQSAAIGDANNKFDPSELFPDKIVSLDDEWKCMFSHADSTLAQEYFLEPGYEYAIGAINIPKRYLSQDIRGMPECTTYDNLTIFNNSAFGSLDLTESDTRRAGDL